VKRILDEYGVDFDIVRTERAWHAADLAQDAVAAGCDVVAALSGDGTANEVLNGLMQAQRKGANSCAMGVLCVGTGNDFAYGAGLPFDLEQGCRALAQGHRRKIDVGWVKGGLYPQGRYFGNGVGVGFDAAASFEAAKITRLHGFLCYFLAALKTIFLYYKAPLVTLEYAGRKITQPALLVSIMNGRRMGGGFTMAPEARPDDGLFDLCIAREVNRARILALVPHFMRGTQSTQRPIKTGRAQRVTITAIEGVLPAHADGEMLCTEGQRLELELLPRRIDIVCPPPEGVEALSA